MKRISSRFVFLAGVAAVLAFSSVAMAQSVSKTTTGGGPSTLTINLNITIEQAIVLNLTGNGSDPSTTFSGIVASTSADVNFGTNNTSSVGAPSTGAKYRLTNETGARFVATIDAQVVATGDATPTFNLGIQAPVVGGINANLFYVCGGDGSCPGVASDTYWRVPGNGNPILAATSGVELAAGAASGTIVEHQLAIEILDSEAAGALSLAVLYTAAPI